MSHQRLSPAEAIAARNDLLKNHILPFVATVFEKHARLRSAVMCVAQLHLEEALDAVHYHFVWSELETPKVNAGLSAIYEERDETNLPTLNIVHTDFVSDWDENGDTISVIAPYCKEGCDDETPPLDCFLPFAVFRREAKGVQFLMAPRQRRPWLEGVRPVGEDEELFEAIYKKGKGEPVIDGSPWWEMLPKGSQLPS